MRKRIAYRLIVIGALAAMAAALALSFLLPIAQSNTMDNPIQISLGQPGADVVKQSPVPIKHSGVDGLRMYEVGKYVNRIEPIVAFKETSGGITFPVARNLDFYEDNDGKGIYEIQVDLRLPVIPKTLADTAAMSAYDEAVRMIVQDTIDRINQAHWQRWIPFDSPRLSGRDTIAFKPGYRYRGYPVDWRDMVGIDPGYRLTQEDWKSLANTWHYWYWIKNGASIMMRYEQAMRSSDAPLLPETLAIIIKSADDTSFGIYGPSEGDRMKYKQSELLKLLELRKQSEADARAKGAKILEDYKDYAVGGVTLPKSMH